MKRRFVCRDCHYEGSVEVLSPEEAEEAHRWRQRLQRVVCPNCGSPRIDLHD